MHDEMRVKLFATWLTAVILGARKNQKSETLNRTSLECAYLDSFYLEYKLLLFWTVKLWAI